MAFHDHPRSPTITTKGFKTKEEQLRFRVCLRVRRGRGLLAWLCLGWLTCAGPALALGAEAGVRVGVRVGVKVEPGVRLEAATERAQASERAAMGWRLAFASCGLVLVTAGLFSKRTSSNSTVENLRIGLLLLLGLASVASYYDFFQPKPGAGFKHTDVYHYYMASKYFSEVGYFDLYHCTILALMDSGVESRFDLPQIRDQRTLHMHTPETALAAARQCRKQFSDDRWLAFADDVDWFDGKFRSGQWQLIFNDHGYNPSPVWNAIGGAITSRVPLRSAAFSWLIDADRLLGLLAFGLIIWAFGIEVAALSAVVWGTGQHWSHAWIGDSLLRNLWLFAVLAGLCFLKKRREFLAGAFLSLASLLRLFPAIFVFGFALHSGSRAQRELPWKPAARPFALGVATAGLLLLLFAAVSSERGMSAFLEFYQKISVFSDKQSLNKLGLSSLVWRSIMMGTGHLVTGADGSVSLSQYAPAWLPFVVRGVQLAVVIPALLLFWRAVGRIRGWESAALSFALIPLLSDPANYYFGFVICGVLLSTQRPRLQVTLLGSAVLWIANGLWFYRLPQEYLGAGIIAVLLPLLVLYEMSREPEIAPSVQA